MNKPLLDENNALQNLLDSADEQGCDEGLIVVSKTALRELVLAVWGEDNIPDWLERSEGGA